MLQINQHSRVESLGLNGLLVSVPRRGRDLDLGGSGESMFSCLSMTLVEAASEKPECYRGRECRGRDPRSSEVFWHCETADYGACARASSMLVRTLELLLE